MTSDYISPMNAQLIASKTANTSTPKTTETTTNSQTPKKINKKALALSFAAAASISAIALGGIMYGKSDKIKNLIANFDVIRNKAKTILETSKIFQKEAQTIQKEAQDTLAHSKNVFDEVMEYIQEGQKNNYANVAENGNIVRRFTTETVNGQVIPKKLTEYSTTGNMTQISRVTEISGQRPFKISEFVGDTERKYVYSKGSLKECYEGLKFAEDGTAKASEVFLFGDNSTKYLKNADLTKGGSTKASEVYDFADGRLASYSKDAEFPKGGGRTSSETYHYVDDKLNSYKKGCEIAQDGSEKSSEVFNFRDDSLCVYQKDLQEAKDGSQKMAEVYTLDKDNTLVYAKGYEEAQGQEEKVAEIYTTKI